MSKLYKWLANYIVRPYKKLEHFRKWLAIFSRAKTYLQKKKIRKRKAETYLSPMGEAHLSSQAQPTRRGAHASSSPSRQASSSPASAVLPPGSCLPAQGLSPRLETSGRRPAPFPSLQSHVPLLPRRVRHRQKKPPEQDDALAWPSTSRSRKTFSPEFLFEFFVDLRKMASKEPP